MDSTVETEGKHEDPHKHHIRGDLNHDGCVNMDDMQLFQETFGKKKGDPGFNPEADFNRDGVVNIQDFQVMRENFHKGCS